MSVLKEKVNFNVIEALEKAADKLGFIVGLWYKKEMIGRNTIQVKFYNNNSANGIELFTKDLSTWDGGENVELSGSGYNSKPLYDLFEKEKTRNKK